MQARAYSIEDLFLCQRIVAFTPISTEHLLIEARLLKVCRSRLDLGGSSAGGANPMRQSCERRPRLGITNSLCGASPSTDGHPRRPPRHPRYLLLFGLRNLVRLVSLSPLHLSASTPARSLSSGPVLRSPHVSRIGYYLIDDVRSNDVHLSSLNYRRHQSHRTSR